MGSNNQIIELDCKGVYGSISDIIYTASLEGKIIVLKNIWTIYKKSKFRTYLKKVNSYAKLGAVIDTSCQINKKYFFRCLAVKLKVYKLAK